MAITPVFRMFDEAATKRFYLDFLRFSLAWEHRFEPDTPLYMAVTHDGIALHLSQHHGDCCPGGHVRIDHMDVVGLQQGLLAQNYPGARPGPPEMMPWGLLEFSLTDPSGNRLTFSQPSVAS